MLTVGEKRLDGCRYPRRPVGGHHQNTLKFRATMLPLTRPLDSYSTQGPLSADPLHAQFEADPPNEQLSKLFWDGSFKPRDQLPLVHLVHPAHLGRAHVAAPEQMRDLASLACKDRSDKHHRDGLIDLFILSAAATYDGVVSDSRPSAFGQAQIPDMPKGCSWLAWPRPIAAVFSQKGCLIRLGADEFDFVSQTKLHPWGNNSDAGPLCMCGKDS